MKKLFTLIIICSVVIFSAEVDVWSQIKKLQAEQNWSALESTLTSEIQKHPKDQDLSLALARVLIWSRQYEKAERFLKENTLLRKNDETRDLLLQIYSASHQYSKLNYELKGASEEQKQRYRENVWVVSTPLKYTNEIEIENEKEIVKTENVNLALNLKIPFNAGVVNFGYAAGVFEENYLETNTLLTSEFFNRYKLSYEFYVKNLKSEALIEVHQSNEMRGTIRTLKPKVFVLPQLNESLEFEKVKFKGGLGLDEVFYKDYAKNEAYFDEFYFANFGVDFGSEWLKFYTSFGLQFLPDHNLRQALSLNGVWHLVYPIDEFKIYTLSSFKHRRDSKPSNSYFSFNSEYKEALSLVVENQWKRKSHQIILKNELSSLWTQRDLVNSTSLDRSLEKSLEKKEWGALIAEKLSWSPNHKYLLELEMNYFYSPSTYTALGAELRFSKFFLP